MKKIFTVLFAGVMIMCGGLTVKAETIAKAPENQLYVIQDGAIYYESSAKGGSGRSAVVGEKNIYTDSPCFAALDGYSYLDGAGEPILSDYIPEEYDINIPNAPEGAFYLMVHFKTPICGRNGWVSYEELEAVDAEKMLETLPEEPVEEVTQEEAAPEEVVEKIERAVVEAEKMDETTVVAIDFSGSMCDNQAEVVKQLEKIEFGENTKIIVFAEISEVVTHQQLLKEEFDVGGGTHMMQALNKAISYQPANIIIISDLDTYDDVELEPAESLKKAVIYDPEDEMIDSEIMEYIQSVWTEAVITRTKISK